MNMTMWIFFMTHSYEVPEGKFKHFSDFLWNLFIRKFLCEVMYFIPHNIISCFVTVFFIITDSIYNLYLERYCM